MSQSFCAGLEKHSWASSEQASLCRVSLCDPLGCSSQVGGQQAQTRCAVLRQARSAPDAEKTRQLSRDQPATTSQSLSQPSPWCQALFSCWTFVPARGSQRWNLTPASASRSDRLILYLQLWWGSNYTLELFFIGDVITKLRFCEQTFGACSCLKPYQVFSDLFSPLFLFFLSPDLFNVILFSKLPKAQIWPPKPSFIHTSLFPSCCSYVWASRLPSLVWCTDREIC